MWIFGIAHGFNTTKQGCVVFVFVNNCTSLNENSLKKKNINNLNDLNDYNYNCNCNSILNDKNNMNKTLLTQLQSFEQALKNFKFDFYTNKLNQTDANGNGDEDSNVL